MLWPKAKKTGDAPELADENEKGNLKQQLRDCRGERRFARMLAKQVENGSITRDYLSEKNRIALEQFENDTLRLRQNRLTQQVGTGHIHCEDGAITST